LRGIVPDRIIDRPKKGFGVPTSRWLRELAPPGDLRAFGIAPAGVARLWNDHKRGTADHRLALWCLMSLQYRAAA
jgi:asparagine synthase (glutamine-hydrolysing)